MSITQSNAEMQTRQMKECTKLPDCLSFCNAGANPEGPAPWPCNKGKASKLSLQIVHKCACLVGNSRRERWRGSLPHGVEQWLFEIVGTSVLSSQIHSQTENLQNRVPIMNMGTLFFSWKGY